MLNLIANPNANKGRGKRLLRQVEARLKEENVEYRAFYPARPGQIGQFARCLSESGERLIVAMGGDGTLNEVLAGIVDPAAVELGLIPAGTGNDFAATARIPDGLKALDLILGGESKYTDYIEFSDGRRSLNIAGLGIDVDILERCERMKGGRKGKYFRGLLASLCKYRGVRVTATAEGETKSYNALIAAVCNGRQLGGGIRLCPVAEIDDGQMDLVVADCPAKRRRLIVELLYLMRGKILSRSILHHVRCTRAEIVPEAPCFAQYDGELMPAETLSAELVSGKLRMFRG